jgi:hypothetical protein
MTMADRRLFDSSSMTPPPAPEIDAMTCTVDEGFVPEPQPYPEIKKALHELAELMAERRAKPRTMIEEIFDRLHIDGEATVEIGDTTYRLTTSLEGHLRTEVIRNGDYGPVRELYSYIDPHNQRPAGVPVRRAAAQLQGGQVMLDQFTRAMCFKQCTSMRPSGVF